MTRRYKLSRITTRFLLYALAIVVVVFTLMPVVWILSSSFKDHFEIMSMTPTVIPKSPTIENYINIFEQSKVGTFVKNSLIVTVASMIATVFFAVFASYAISFFKFKGRNFFSGMMLMLQILPMIVSIVPLYIMFNRMGISNTLFSLTIANVAKTSGVPIAIILIGGYFTEVPRELTESASLDGLSKLRSLFSIVIPITLPGIISTAIYTFVMVWQEFMLATSLITDISLFTLPVGLETFRGHNTVDWGGIMATSTVIAIPAIILFIAVQKYFIDSMAGAIKG